MHNYPILYWRSRIQIASEASPGNRAGLNHACKRFDRASRLTGPAGLSGLACLHVNRLLEAFWPPLLTFSRDSGIFYELRLTSILFESKKLIGCNIFHLCTYDISRIP